MNITSQGQTLRYGEQSTGYHGKMKGCVEQYISKRLGGTNYFA